MAQGPHRLARRLSRCERCKPVAEDPGVRFGWKLESGAGAGHVEQDLH
jgi:hypothetical protein